MGVEEEVCTELCYFQVLKEPALCHCSEKCALVDLPSLPNSIVL